MATDGIPGTGYSILYEYGIFKQKIVDGWQQEPPTTGCPAVRSGSRAIPTRPRRSALTARPSRPGTAASTTSSMRTTTRVIAVPNDMYVAGYGSNGVSKLRLWQAKAPSFDMSSFNAGNYNTRYQPELPSPS